MLGSLGWASILPTRPRSYYYAHQPETEKGFPAEAVVRQAAPDSRLCSAAKAGKLDLNRPPTQNMEFV